MAGLGATPVTPLHPPTAQELWSAGDYDRRASYASAAEPSHLVRFAGVQPGERVLDVATGSGIVADLTFRYLSPMPGPSLASPLWGDSRDVRRYLEGVRTLAFEHRALLLPALSPSHARLLLRKRSDRPCSSCPP
jgi:hypothetical protein